MIVRSTYSLNVVRPSLGCVHSGVVDTAIDLPREIDENEEVTTGVPKTRLDDGANAPQDENVFV